MFNMLEETLVSEEPYAGILPILIMIRNDWGQARI